MSLKQDYLSVLTNYEEQRKRLNTSNLSTDTYSSEYIEKAKQEDLEKLFQLKKEITSQLIKILDKALETYNNNMSSTMINRLENIEYQTGITSLIEAIKANAISSKQFERLRPKYEDDPLAANRINSAITKSQDVNLGVLIYKEDKTPQYLEQLKSNVQDYIENKHARDEELALVGMKDFIQDKLDDNLNYKT